MNLRIALILGLSSLTLLGGCAVGRSDLDITPPVAHGKAQAAGKEVFIIVTDRRVFEEKPGSPRTPSLDPSQPQDDAVKARAVGRKRGDYGKALGDLVLKEGQTVEKLMTDTIRQAFVEKGYRLIDRKEDITPNTLLVNADIDKFWSWATPGAGFILSTEISTNLALQPGEPDKAITVSTSASDHYLVASDKNWAKVINRALRAYFDNLKAKLK